MKTDKFRILVDWDGDGKVHSGVPVSAHPNLIPNPYFMQQSNVRGTTISGREEPINRPTITKDVDASLGFQYASIPCGGSNSKQVWVGLNTTKRAQAYPNEILSAFGSTTRQLSTFIKAWTKEDTAYGEYAQDISATDFLYPTGSIPIYLGAKYDAVLGSGSFTTTSTMVDYPVTAGATYRVTLWHRFKLDPLLNGGGTNNIPLRISVGYINTAYYPTFTSTANTTMTLSASNTWTQVTFTFTAAVGQTKCVIRIEQTGAQVGSGFYQVIGASVLPSASNPTYVADPAITYGTENFKVQLKAATAYNYSFYAKATSFTKIGVLVHGVDVGTATWTQLLAEQQSNTSGSWARYNVSFTTGANPQYAMLQIIPYVGSNPASAGVTGTLDVRAFQLTEGAALYPLNAGATSAYDDISDYVVDFAWKFGKKSLEEPMPYEGTLDLTLNNTSKLFSPANTASVLYGSFNQNRKVILQIKHPTTGAWTTMWAGWLDAITATAGRNSDRRVKIHCKQGIYRFRDGDFSVAVEKHQPFQTIVQNIVEAGSWRSAQNAYEGVLGFNMRLGENFYISDTTAAFNSLDEGINTYDLQGLDWGRNTTTQEALNDIFNAENANMWIDRAGLINVKNRNYWAGRFYDPDVVIDLNTNVQQADYGYGDNLVNDYEVEYQPAKFNTNQTVWQTKGSLLIGAGNDRTVALVFSLPEGRIKTVANIQKAVVLTVYAKDPNDFPSEIAIVDTAILNKITATVYQQGNRFSLYLKNDNTTSYYIQALVKGDAVDTGDKLAGTYSDRASIAITVAKRSKHSSNPVISSVPQAEAVATFFVSRNAFPVGEFNRLKVVDDDTLATYNLIMSLALGNVLQLKEEQTVETGRLSVIVEEAGYYNGGSFTFDATLDKLDALKYMRLDVGVVESSNALVAASHVGVRGATSRDTYDNLIPIKEYSSGERDGWIYLPDDLTTVRSWLLDRSNLEGVYYDAPSYFNPIGTIKGGITKAFVKLESVLFGAKPFVGGQPVLDPLTLNRNDGASNRGIHVQASAQIPIERNTFYKIFLNGNGVGIAGLGASLTYFSDIYFNVKAFCNVMRNNNMSYAGENGNMSWWGVLSGTRTIENNTDTFKSRTGVEYDGTSGVTYLYTQGSSDDFVSPLNRADLPITHMGLYIAQNNNGSSSNPMYVYGLDIVKYSNLKNNPIDSTKSYKFATWLRTAPASMDVNYTIELLDVDHNVIASTTVTPNAYTITKAQITLPSGYSYVTPRIRKTSANTEFRDDKLWVYGAALTEETLTYYTDIPANTSYVYI